MSDVAPPRASVLIVDQDLRVRQGLQSLLMASNLDVTATGDADHALQLFKEKFFSVAVLDMDTPIAGAGIELMSRIRIRSSATPIVLMTARQTFDLAVRGFRGGAANVIAKAPHNVKYLHDEVRRLCEELRDPQETRIVLGDALEIHEELLRRLIDASRRAEEADERASGMSGNSRAALLECVILVIDDNAKTGPGLQEAMGIESGYRIVSKFTGGEALDFAGTEAFHLALVKESLPDLSGATVSRSLRVQAPDAIVLLFRPPESDGTPGRVVIVEDGHTIELIPELVSGAQLVERLYELRDAYVAKVRARRHLQVFREQHYEFLRRYSDLRRKLAQMVPHAH